MTDEDAFLRKILENPADDVTRLVYADWLEEREEMAKVEFLRKVVELDQVKNRRRLAIQQRLQQLAAVLDTRWLPVVSKMRIENCKSGGTLVYFWHSQTDTSPTYLCPQQWEKLKTTDQVDVRYCTSCKKEVHYCDTIQVGREKVSENRCVVLDLGIVRRERDMQGDLDSARREIITSEFFEREAERLRLDPVSEAREAAKKLAREQNQDQQT